MSNTVLNNKSIVKSFEEILKSLSEKERSVIEKRVWLNWEKETLQNIWNSFSPSITRERVRQIEDSWIKKIGRIIKATLLTKIQERAIHFIWIHWWVISRDRLINNIIKDLQIEDDVNSSILEIIIQSDFEIKKSKQKLWCQIYFHLPNITKSNIDNVYKEAIKVLKRKKDVMDKTSLFEIISDNLKEQWKINIIFIDSCLELFDDIVYWEENLVWLTKWKILNPKTLKDKAIYVMKKEKLPMHFVDISNKITDMLEEKVKVNTIHNELIRNNEFVLIGRWIYALKEWWFNPWTVLDVITSILEKNWEPMSTEEITKEVLKTRNVKQTTIYMNLQNKKVIERVGRNYYQLKK